jgi:hypothetical protein
MSVVAPIADIQSQRSEMTLSADFVAEIGDHDSEEADEIF